MARQSISTKETEQVEVAQGNGLPLWKRLMDLGIILVLLPGPVIVGGLVAFVVAAGSPGPVRVGHSRIGVFDVIRQPPSLDPRMEGALPEFRNLEAPVAQIGSGPVLPEGKAIQLDGSASKPPAGRAIREYRWRRLK